MCHAVFDIFDALMEYLPDNNAKMANDGPDGFGIAQPGQQMAELLLENASFGADRGLSCLTESNAQVTVCLGAAAAVVLLRTFILARLTPIQELNWVRKEKLWPRDRLRRRFAGPRPRRCRGC